MNLKAFLALAVLSLAGILPLIAQNTPTPNPAPAEEGGEKKAGETPGNNRFWQASVGGGNFMVALDKIVSVSRSKYIMNGTVMVDEVAVDTVGQALARFYFVSPISASASGLSVADATKRAQELLDHVESRTGTNLQGTVEKTYPATTHAKSIEFQVTSESDLSALYNSVKNAWESGRGRQFNAKK